MRLGTSQLYLRAVLCIPLGIHKTALRVQVTYTLESHGTTTTWRYFGLRHKWATIRVYNTTILCRQSCSNDLIRIAACDYIILPFTGFTLVDTQGDMYILLPSHKYS